MTPNISVIIVSWNVARSLKRCLESVFATLYPDLEVFVIDNASTDDSVKVAKSFSKVNVRANFNNIGFPQAVNIGLRQSRGDYILLLNPDTRLPKDFFVKALEFAQSHSNMGVMGPKFTNPDGTPQGSVFPEPSILNTINQKGQSLKECPETDKPITVNAISGACMWLSKSTVVKIGEFTKKVFMYYEDLDYCRRIRTAGLKVYFNPDITIVHEHGRSSTQSPDAQKYLWQSSIWYNGPLKHYLIWLISWSGQKFQKLLSGNVSTKTV
ncbi:glycosyltransferase family 2 protein [Candidatus Amesbacteria bacterium]|nr:glycosyltransferase family 2 protein [Candidatus Amesbacteria bacterium]